MQPAPSIDTRKSTKIASMQDIKMNRFQDCLEKR